MLFTFYKKIKMVSNEKVLVPLMVLSFLMES